MNLLPTQARSHLASFLIFLAVGAGAGAQTPTADKILEVARLNPMSQQARLKAALITEDGVKMPFTLSLDHGVVNYDFTNPDQRIQLVLGPDSSELRERLGDKTRAVKPARFDQSVRGTLINYEDLALRFLYWPGPKLLGSDTIKLQSAWKLEIQAPRGQSAYGVVRVWIGKSSGAVLRIEGYGKDGRLIKDFEVISGQPIEGQWTLKTMRIQAHDPNTQKVTDYLYLKVLGEDK